MILYHGPETASDEDWDEALAHYVEIADNSFTIEKIFIFSQGGALHSLQRRKLANIFKERTHPSSYIFTDNKFIKGVGFLLTLLGLSKFTTLNPNDVEGELQSIGLDSYQVKRVTTVVQLLEKRLDSKDALYN